LQTHGSALGSSIGLPEVLERVEQVLKTEEVRRIIQRKNKHLIHFYIDKPTKQTYFEKDRHLYDPKNARQIIGPNDLYARVQDILLGALDILLDEEVVAHGFVAWRNPETNAAVHSGNSHFVHIDLKDAFHSVKYEDVKSIGREIGLSGEDSKDFSRLLTLNGRCPQGFITSPKLMNLRARKLDQRLGILAKKNRLTFSRYADDLVLSASQPIPQKLINLIFFIIKDSGWIVNKKKVKISSENNQTITGALITSTGQILPKTKITKHERLFRFIQKRSGNTNRRTPRNNNVDMVLQGFEAYRFMITGQYTKKKPLQTKSYRRMKAYLQGIDKLKRHYGKTFSRVYYSGSIQNIQTLQRKLKTLKSLPTLTYKFGRKKKKNGNTK
jgi:hypothetical protein